MEHNFSICRTHENCEGIYFIDPEGKEFKETIKNARKKLETSVAPAMPCKIVKKNCGSGGSNKIEQDLSVFWKLMNLQDCVWEIQYQIIMKTILQESKSIYCNITLWFTNLFPCLEPWRFPKQRQQWTRSGKNEEKIRSGTWQVRSKSEVIDEARTLGAKVHFASSMDICHLKNAELEAIHQKSKGRVVLRGDIVKDNSGSYAVFTEQGSSASQMTAAKIMDIISRLLGCDGQAADAVSAYTQVKMEDAHKSFKIPKIGVSRYLDSSTTTQMTKIMVQYGRPSRSSWAESVRSSFWQDYCGKGNLRKSIETWLGENSNLGMSLCTSWKRIIIICVCGWHKIGWKETKSWSDVESTQQRSRFGRTNIFLGSCILGLHSTTMPNKQRYCGQLQNHVRIANFRGKQKNCHSLKIFVFLHGLMIWRVMPRSVWNDIVSWRTRRLSNSTQYLLLASMTTTFKEEETKSVGELSRYMLSNCSEMLLNLARIGRPDILLSVNKLARSITNWTKPVTNAWIDWFHIFITHVNTNNLVMWVILQNNADWDCFKTLTSREILMFRNPLLEEHCAFSEVIHLFQ